MKLKFYISVCLGLGLGYCQGRWIRRLKDKDEKND